MSASSDRLLSCGVSSVVLLNCDFHLCPFEVPVFSLSLCSFWSCFVFSSFRTQFFSLLSSPVSISPFFPVSRLLNFRVCSFRRSRLSSRIRLSPVSLPPTSSFVFCCASFRGGVRLHSRFLAFCLLPSPRELCDFSSSAGTGVSARKNLLGQSRV
ncbi:hypothetical protein TGPRC2_205110 [Toxoplasma gondii TgCatPRC2]|uniref:Uncharacterized protein n=3 Tax=Toxoplasma gondii TaxID=5811 RepID=A0A151HAI4_TOXGO|nr:hypothetical protein TGMAS_205110 [Toxoplasma gondii MAS]KYK66344.1 hypothetical protein TGPRC2_205110 [Toxoplasma gondii TgCatPRC2]PUA85581.1 hypothetical protein TGBR9_205110 [Toxoplasma gondii TgCATBr9]